MLELGLLKTGLRGLQLLWCLLLTALIGNVIALSTSASSSATAAVNFSMFVIVASWLASLYGFLARLFPTLESTNIQLPADAAGSLLTFIDAVVLSAKLGVVNCGDIGDKKDDLPGSWIAWGSANDEKRCREIQAGAAFMWFLFACFVASAFFTWKDSRPRGFSIPTSRPSMTQISV
ncbi:hypothetical protein VUR80DRAFT_2535 [Thermomyces stellatus]